MIVMVEECMLPLEVKTEK
jgi:hypothetical protein